MLRLGLVSSCCAATFLSAATAAIGAPAPNDNFADATVITSLPFSDVFDPTEATFEQAAGEPSTCSPFFPGGPGEPPGPQPQTLWYRYTVPHAVVLRFDVSTPTGGVSLGVYPTPPSGFPGGGVIACLFYGPNFQTGPVDWAFEAGEIVTLQGISSDSNEGHVDVSAVPPPPNDNFADATVVGSLPFHDEVDLSGATIEPGEQIASCSADDPKQSAWYEFTPVHTGKYRVQPSNTIRTAAYTGSAVGALTEVACTVGSQLDFTAQAGTTYWLRIGPARGSPPTEVDIEELLPQVAFSIDPSDPSSFDTIAFTDTSTDPLGVAFAKWSWTFGDGSTATGCCVGHRYKRDGTYPVELSVQTSDGRTATATQPVGVFTHDVFVKSLSAPAAGNVGQTALVTTTIKTTRYPETAFVHLQRRIGLGQFVEVASDFATVAPGQNAIVNLPYTFSTVDGSARRVTFRVQLELSNARDALPDNNTATAAPTVVKPAKPGT